MRSIPQLCWANEVSHAVTKELIQFGLENVEVSKYAVVTAFLPANDPNLTKTIGLVAHLDTSPQCSGKMYAQK